MSVFKHALFAIIAGALIMMVSCGKDEETPLDCHPEEHFSYLKPGNKWVYDYWEFFSLDTLMELKIVETVQPGMMSVTFDVESSIMPPSAIWYCCGNSISTLNAITDNPDDRVFTRKNTTVGDTWQAHNNGAEGNYEVVAKNVEVTTGAGTFLCDKIAFHITGAFNVDTIYENSQYGTIIYDGMLQGYELRSKNF